MIFKRFVKFIYKYGFFFIVVTSVLFPALFGSYIHFDWIVVSYSVSVVAKKLLLGVLPFLIFPLIVNSIILVPSGIGKVMLGIIAFVFLSNFTSVIIAYLLAMFITQVVEIPNNFITNSQSVYSLIDFNLYDIGLVNTSIFAILVGIILRYVPKSYYLHVIKSYYQISRNILNRVFTFFLPTYIFGSILKFTYEINILSLLRIFGKLVLYLFLFQSLYISCLFLIGSRGNLKQCVFAIRNTLTAWLVGFSTMSSIITLPTTLKSVAKTTNNNSIAELTANTTVNCHDIGDCISLPLCALVLVYCISGMIPSFMLYLQFAFYVALMQFSSVSVPGGSVVVLLPLLGYYFGFTDAMGSLLIIISIFIEPIGTAMNVAGNNALALIMSKLFTKKQL
jgi:Na+/H+-dicarboxylate symporter